MRQKKFQINKERGFTLIETLVAITILMIAIAGPLTVAHKAYTSALDARNQTIAYNLAQEALEYINAVKDTTGDFGAISGCASDPSFWCSVSGIQAGFDQPFLPANMGQNIRRCSETNNCKLTLHNNEGYTYDSTNESTPFTRYFYVGSVSDEALVTVVVSWNTGSLTNQVKIEQLLTNHTR